jgi:hypothetical protein
VIWRLKEDQSFLFETLLYLDMQLHARQKTISFQNQKKLAGLYDSNVTSNDQAGRNYLNRKRSRKAINLKVRHCARHGINIREIIRRFNDSTPLKYRAVLSPKSVGASLLLSNLPGTLSPGEVARYYIIERLGCKCGASGAWRGRVGQRVGGTCVLLQNSSGHLRGVSSLHTKQEISANLLTFLAILRIITTRPCSLKAGFELSDRFWHKLAFYRSALL